MTAVTGAPPLVALADEAQPRRAEILAVFRSERRDLFVPAPVTAEIDYRLGIRLGAPARRAFGEDVAARTLRRSRWIAVTPASTPVSPTSRARCRLTTSGRDAS